LLEGLNIVPALRIIVRPLEKAAAGPGNPFAYSVPHGRRNVYGA